ncbi:MAG: ABC transporter permease [bacterium]|nr:ABC transporter permease [bacterium]
MKRPVGRLLGALGVWLGVATLTFLLLRVLPADPARTIAGAQADAETLARIRQGLGLDAPLPLQLVRYLGGLLRGDWGDSLVTGRPVLAQLLERFPATLTLGGAALTVSLTCGSLLGLTGGLRPGRLGDRVGLVLAAGAVSVPTFWLGMMLLYVVSYRLGWLPLGGSGSWQHLVLPAITLGTGGMAYYARLLRTQLIEVMRQEYIRTGKAKGLSPAEIVVRHALPNASLPLVTALGTDLGHLLGGAMVTETLFGWPGLGQGAFEAIASLDAPMLMGTVLFGATAIVVATLLTDAALTWLDPRLRRSENS